MDIVWFICVISLCISVCFKGISNRNGSIERFNVCLEVPLLISFTSARDVSLDRIFMNQTNSDFTLAPPKCALVSFTWWVWRLFVLFILCLKGPSIFYGFAILLKWIDLAIEQLVKYTVATAGATLQVDKYNLKGCFSISSFFYKSFLAEQCEINMTTQNLVCDKFYSRGQPFFTCVCFKTQQLFTKTSFWVSCRQCWV